MTSRCARIVAALAIPATGLLFSACSASATEQDQSASSTSSTNETLVIEGTPAGFNADDVDFFTNMIPHHYQAVEMAELVPDRSTNPRVMELAETIVAAQKPEIEVMKVLLVQWKEGDAGDAGASDGHGGHGAGMPGMVDEAGMTQLGSLSGAEFDTLWLRSMIDHHRGAVEMAKAEVAHGENVDAVSLAKKIAETQQAEIDQMNQMLGG